MTAAVRRRSARRALSVTVVAGVMLTSAASVAAPVAEVELVISEIMYNPASAEDDWEWVEVYNAGSSEVDLTGFVIDDINSLAHPGSNIAGGTVAAGGTAVLYNADDLSAVDVEAAWGTGIPLVPVSSNNLQYVTFVRIDGTGKRIKSFNYDDEGYCDISAAAAVPDGGCILAGSSKSTRGLIGRELVCLRYNPDNTIGWSRRIGSSNSMRPVGAFYNPDDATCLIVTAVDSTYRDSTTNRA